MLPTGEIIELRCENAELKQQIIELKQRIAELEAMIAQSHKKDDTKPHFVKENKKKSEKKQKRRKRAGQHNRARRREKPTRIETHRPAACPTCERPLTKHRSWYSRQIVDIPEPQPVEVVQYELEEGWCEQCQQWHQPSKPWSPAIGKGRIGVRLLGVICYMRHVLRLPFRQIRRLLYSLHRVTISVGQITNVCQRVAVQLDDEVVAIREQARGSPALHADETGWREDGVNGYIWCLATDHPQPVRYYEYHQSRAGKVIKAMLGETFSGTLITDFYSAYNIYEGRHQRCWVHFIRDLKALYEAHPTDVSVTTWCVAVINLYHLAREWAQDNCSEQVRDVERLVEMSRQLGVLHAQQDHPCRALAKRLLRHMDELFLFVEQPLVAADNNLAERAVRHIVIQRKISGGSRSSSGSETTMKLTTLFQTWIARGLNPLHQCWQSLGYQPIYAISQ